MSEGCAPLRRGHGHTFGRTLAFGAACLLGLATAEARVAPLAPQPETNRRGRLFAAPLELPQISWSRACSLRHPLCAYAPQGSPDRELVEVLGSADHAWDVLVDVLGVPPPTSGLDATWDLRIVDAVEGAGCAQVVALDPRTRFERGASVALVDRTARGCALDVAVARALAQGSLLAAAPETPDGLFLAESEQLARLATSCTALDEGAIEFQSEPERTLVDGRSTAFARGGAAFFEWLERTFARGPGALVPALWALAPERLKSDGTHAQLDATAFDVLAASLRGAYGTDSTLDDVLVAFAVARVEMWPPVHAAWAVKWPARPRRLVSAEPVAPTGASYVFIRREGAQPGSRLRLEMEWEDYARMRWVGLKLDSDGRVLAQIRVSSPNFATQAAMTLDGLDGTDRVVVVGVNVGSTEHTFLPAQGEWEAHGWTLTVESLP